MKNLKTYLLAFMAIFFISGNIIAQEKTKIEHKKVVIIKKTIDEDGNEVIEKIIKEGDAAEDFEWHQKGEHGKVMIIKDGEGKEKRVKVIIDGEEEVLNEWHELHEGHGEMNQNVNVNVEENDGVKTVTIERTDENGKVETIKWQGDGEFPEDLKKELLEKGVHLEMIHEGHKGEHLLFDTDKNKVFLGVVGGKTVEVKNENGIEEKIVSGADDRGVLIKEVVEGSAAAKAGLEAEDIITAIDGKAVADFDILGKLLSKYKVGDKITVAFLRDNRAKETSATLKARGGKYKANKFKFFSEDEEHEMHFEGEGETILIEIEEDEDGEEKMIIKKQIIVKEGEHEDVIELDNDFESESKLHLDELEIFPNPTDGMLKVKFKGEAVPTTVLITDITGKQIYKVFESDFDGTFDKEVDLEKIAKGVLVLTIKQGDKVYAEKITLQ